MNEFLKKTILFFLPVLGFLIITNLFFPASFWSYRCWEGFLVKNKTIPCSIGHFYPNLEEHKIEQGDLAHHSEFAIPKKVLWKTDNLGYRNDDNAYTEMEILLMGDSFIAGAALDQSETLSNNLKKITNKKVYQIAPAGFMEFKKLLDLKIISKPKILIYSCGEGSIPTLEKFDIKESDKQEPDIIERVLYKIRLNSLLNFSFVQMDKLFKNAFILYLRSRLNSWRGSGLQSSVEPKMFFWQGKDAEVDYNDSIISGISDVLSSYNEFCKSIGVDFIFLPFPAKETMYYEFVPFDSQPLFLKNLTTVLNEKSIATVNTLDFFNENKPKGLLYHYDDTHCNGFATQLLSEEIVECYLTR